MNDSVNMGFTLIELLVVVALAGLITLFALPTVTSYFKVSLNSATREIGSIVKEAYNSTVVTGKVHRVVYDFKENTYWVEVGSANVLLDTEETRQHEERKRRFATSKEKEKEPPSLFQLAKTVTRKKLSLPRGVTYEDILTEQSHEPITQGTAYTHIFPHGVTEQTILHLKDSQGHHVSLILSSLIGRTHVVDHYVKEEEAFAQ